MKFQDLIAKKKAYGNPGSHEECHRNVQGVNAGEVSGKEK